MLSYRERVDDSLLGPLPDLSLTEAADGAKFINAGGEELFWSMVRSLTHMASSD